ncbi:MAG: Unknown protein [uncultured Aureispira sp.]|uniref:Secretion system C-terminal sorting domain-containing protein n=1 Tax=uncultured Aureispira sp. TaxID=1331704 RepID=A0A6S6SIH9_9BACT|nr:MAG: Unknown protein [uncultured Aureispira sp.]
MKIIYKKIILVIVFMYFMNPLKAQTVNWSVETGLNVGDTFIDGQIISDINGTGLDVQINLNIVNGYPRIGAGGTSVNLVNSDGASFSLTFLNGSANVVLSNYLNLLQGEQIVVSNPDGENITIEETSSNAPPRMRVDGVAMTGSLPSTIVEDATAVVKETNNGAGTRWNASMFDVTGFSWTYNISPTGQTGNEGFSLVIDNSTLPVELTDFTATKKEKGVQLNWNTSSELNNDYFAVQRSKDGSTWEEIARLKGHGTTALENTYRYFDEAPFLDVSYYRLKQNDYNGHFSYSSIKAISIEENSELQIFPNPTTDIIHVLGANIQKSELEIMDIRGKTYTHLVDVKILSDNRWRIDLSQLPIGIYYLKTRVGSMRKIIKH